jgi:hypothetical protein
METDAGEVEVLEVLEGAQELQDATCWATEVVVA